MVWRLWTYTLACIYEILGITVQMMLSSKSKLFLTPYSRVGFVAFGAIGAVYASCKQPLAICI